MHPIRHVEGRCADQEYFGSVNDNYHAPSNSTAYLGMLPLNNYFSPHNHYSPNEVQSSQIQKKRHLPVIPGSDALSGLIPGDESFDFTETSIDIEADEILRYQEEKQFEPINLKNETRSLFHT